MTTSASISTSCSALLIKGIPLAVVTAIALHELYGKEVRYCCNRKEAKDHGADAGNLLGATSTTATA